MMKDNIDTILAVDDSHNNLKVLVELLGDNYDVIIAQNGTQALEIIKKEPKIDLILLDIMMPVLNGYDTCIEIKKDIKSKDIPIIFLTAKTDEESIEKAYEVGAVDYIKKPFLNKELLLRVQTQLELRSLIKKLNYYSSYDTMTGLYNRRVFFQKAKNIIKNKTDIFVAMIDIDDFKNVNDTYGHDMGDLVIKTITKTIKDNFDNDVIFARLGGEEFAILYEEKSLELVEKKFDDIREQIANLKIKSTKNEDIKCTISIGLAKKSHIDEKIDPLLKKADESLYGAKNNGKNKTIYRRT